jgi:hypothetical protein
LFDFQGAGGHICATNSTDRTYRLQRSLPVAVVPTTSRSGSSIQVGPQQSVANPRRLKTYIHWLCDARASWLGQ